MENYQIYNSSGDQMDEVADGTVDLILTSPSYNAGAVYGDWKDSAPFDEFKKHLEVIVKESARTLSDGGRLIIECADTAWSDDGKYMSIGAIYTQIGINCGLSLSERHIAFTKTENGIEQVEHGWSDDFVAEEATHSNSHQLIVLQKGTASFNESAGKIIYYNYPAGEENHPSPFAYKLINFILDSYFKPGDTVLDPYMGTARLGREAVKRGGKFIGYDINKEYCETAKKYFAELELETNKEGNE